MPKGNHNPVRTVDVSELYAESLKIKDAAKALAEARRARSPYSVEKQGELLEKLNGYIEKQEKEGKPLTISGFMLAAGIPEATWRKLRNGEYDGMIDEYRILHGVPEDVDSCTTEDGEVISLVPWSEIIGRCYLLTQEQRETACVAGKAGNVIGNIFLLKSQHGLSDQPEMIGKQTNIQIVADAETAKKALEMCK